MLPFLVAAALAGASPSPCPSDLLVANPRLKVVRAADKTRDNYVVDGRREEPRRLAAARGNPAASRVDPRRHAIGSQPIPALGAGESYIAAFRLQLPHERKREPFTVEFRYVLDSKNALRANCTSVNDRLTATL